MTNVRLMAAVQGPCQLGDIVLMDRDTGVGFCGCNQTLPMYYHTETNQGLITPSHQPAVCHLGSLLFDLN